MASGDSVEDVCERDTSLLPAGVHRICDLDDEAHAPRIALQPGIQQPDDGGELLVVRHASRKACAAREKRQNALSDHGPRHHGVHEDVGIARLGADPPGSEVLLGHFEELATRAMLIDEELGLDVQPERPPPCRLIDSVTLPSPSTTPDKNQRRASSLDSLSC